MKRPYPSLVLIALIALATDLRATADSKPLTLETLLAWKSMGAAVVTPDGAWLGYRLSPNQGDGEIVLRHTQSDKELRFPAGEMPPPEPNFGEGQPSPPAPAVVFSDDGLWASYTIYPTAREARQQRGPNRTPQNKAGLVSLKSFEKVEIDRMKRVAFAGERGGWIALHRYGPADAAAPGASGAQRSDGRPRGSDLILRELATGAEQNIGNVAEFAFDKTGRHLAWTIDAQDQAGNGLFLRNMISGAVATVDSGKASYERPTWTDKGDALAALKGTHDKRFRDKVYALIGYSGLDSSPRKVAFTLPSSVSEGFTISPSRSPMWAEDLSAIYFGIHRPQPARDSDREAQPASVGDSTERPATPDGASSDPDLPALTLWHYRDPRLQSQQQVQEQRDRNFSFLSVYRVRDDRFIRLADEDVREVVPNPRSRWAIGRDVREYELMANLDGRRFEDVYAINVETGERRLAVKRAPWVFDTSPDGSRLLFFDDGQYFVYDMPSAQATPITKSLPVEFWNVDNDRNLTKPPIPPIGWALDGQSVLLSDGWDLWRVAASSGAATNLTASGRKEGIRYRRRFVLDPDERGINLSAAVYLEAYGEWTKKQGIARLDPGAPTPTILGWSDAVTSRLLKPKRAEALFFTRETNLMVPDYYVGDRSLEQARRLSDANPQIRDIAWSSGAQLVNYVNAKGDKLQGALYLPANYEKGKSYPTIVYIYERLSQNLNQFKAPRAVGFNEAYYTSNGYAVFEPDIKYRVNDPGMSAVWSVVPAVKAAIATGIVDAAKVGIQGHSWGGYQTSFLVTQTDIFAAAVAGAPLTNMISMYSLLYKNTGGTNQAIFESNQGRFAGGYWDNLDAYMRNSPVLHAKNVKTPLMLLHNDRDGAVDFTQGMEYFNTLRRLGKPVVMLEYVGENHNLRRPVNQQDYTVRMKEFFDHHLMGKPAPEWLTKGVPRLLMEEHLRQRQQERKQVVGARVTTEGKR
jgi:dipeptidyl aminopeptidase/acylaminoacyl peptidase